MTNKKKIAISILIVILFAVGAFVYFRLRPSPHQQVVKIGIATWPGFASGMIGNDKKYFDGISLEYKVIDDQPARYAAFQQGDIDIINASLDEVAQTSGRLKGKIILVTDTSFGGDGIVVKPDIKTPAQLKGKRIAFARSTPSHYLLYKVLQSQGLSPSDIQQVPVDDPGQAGQAFLGGSVDAAVTWEPFLSEVKNKGNGHVLLTTRDYPGIIVDVLVASDKLAQNPDLLKRFIDGWLRSVQYVKNNPDDSSKLIATGLGVKGEDVQGMMAGLQFVDEQTNKVYFDSAEPSNTKIGNILRDAANIWKSQGIISTIPEIDNLISTFSLKYFHP